MRDEIASYPMKKAKDEMTGFRVRILDDGTFLLCEEHSDYSKQKETAHESASSLMSAVRKMVGDMKVEEDDELK